MAVQRIKAGDEVVVIAGKDRGKRGRVLEILKAKGRVVVEGVNIQVRHLKRNPQNPSAGGRQERPGPIHMSNVLPWSDDDNGGVRVRAAGEGRNKHRLSVKSGKAITATGRTKGKQGGEG